MSTKGSILLTKDNEHWYYDYSDDSITLEISRDNIQADYSDTEDIIIEIKEGCDLWKYLEEMQGYRFKAEGIDESGVKRLVVKKGEEIDMSGILKDINTRKTK